MLSADVCVVQYNLWLRFSAVSDYMTNETQQLALLLKPN